MNLTRHFLSTLSIITLLSAGVVAHAETADQAATESVTDDAQATAELIKAGAETETTAIEAAPKATVTKKVAAKAPTKVEPKTEAVEAPKTSAPASAPVAVERVRAFRDGDKFTAEMQTNAAWNGNDVQVQYFKESIQVDVSGAFLNKGKQLIKVDDRSFKSVYATQFDSTTVRTRFTVNKGVSAKGFANRLSVKRTGGGIIFEITGEALSAKAAGKVSDAAFLLSVNEENAVQESMSAKLVAGAAAATSTVAAAIVTNAADAKTVAVGGDVKADAAAAAAPKKDKLPENEIPVLATAKAEKKADSSPFYRIMTTLGVLAIALGAASYGVKKMAQRQTGKKAQQTKINVLTTHHLGPKKNLMIVQVAGETLLIGVTDHNISMLKTLALIDDEIPADVPQRFDHSMEDFMGDDDEPIRGIALDQIRDSVSKRFKNNRNI